MKLVNMQTTLDRVRGMFIGAFLGDALGAPHEFRCNAKTPYTGVLEHTAFLNTQFQGRKEIAVGQITDDSEMTLTLLRTIIRDKGYNKDNVTLSYLQWANSGGWMLGKNTRALLKGVKTLKGFNKRAAKVFVNPSQSNGALMRCSPLALIYDNNPVIEDVNITNPDPVCVDCNLVYINCLRLALQGYGAEQIFEIAKSIAQTEEVRAILSQVDRPEMRDIKTNKGWCLHGLWCAFTVIRRFTDYSEAMKWIITSQPGSDTDTNACIAGAMLGAIIGFDKINEKEQSNINIMLTVDTQRGPTPRQQEYSPSDFYSLTEQAYALIA